MKPNAFERLIAGSSSQNQTFMLAKNSPKDNKDRLFNECARYVNSLGGKFPHTLKSSNFKMIITLYWENDTFHQNAKL